MPRPPGLLLPCSRDEFVEDLILFPLRDAGAIILDPHVDHASLLTGADFDPAATRAELAGILHQVDQHAARHILIHPDGRQLGRKVG